MKPWKLFVTANHTGAGKTLVSSILVKALSAQYWKPVQTGKENDAAMVHALTAGKTQVIPPMYSLPGETSPHNAAKQMGMEIFPERFVLPVTNKNIVVEGAGGWLAPITKHYFMSHLAKQLQCRVILVVDNYLGGINHALLTVSAIIEQNVKIVGIILNRDDTHGAEEVIAEKYEIPILLRIPTLPYVTPMVISELAEKISFLHTE